MSLHADKISVSQPHQNSLSSPQIPVKSFPDSPISRLRRADDGIYDLICVGFGPASLAIAIALHDAVESTSSLCELGKLHHLLPKVLFIERQEQFRWHPGMLLPGAKMQISFVKDLATMRDPRSEFTFLNYLHKHNRLAHFTNLDTFLPRRIEYEHYMKWCARSFQEVVDYGFELAKIFPGPPDKQDIISQFSIETTEVTTGKVRRLMARNVIIAIGGKPSIPTPFLVNDKRVIHSSQYAKDIGLLLGSRLQPCQIAIVGSGQSAAEIFHDLHSRSPTAVTRLLIRGAALKPSDDSPFVNEIFDPEQVDSFFDKSANEREASIAENRGTNYGVVRSGLLQKIYDDLYMQRIQQPNEAFWQHRILKRRTVAKAESSPNSIRLHIRNFEDNSDEMFDADVVIVATGYIRDGHKTMLDPLRHLTADGANFTVARNYRVEMVQDRVSKNAGIWLQGCNEAERHIAIRAGNEKR